MRYLWLLLCAVALPTWADTRTANMEARPGWAVHPTDKPFDTLVADTVGAVKASALAVVTQAGPTGAAAARGITIPGNRVIGVFNNDFAVRVLEQSTAAMIEAPIRFYITENDDGTATLSYKTPSFVFAPYMGGNDELAVIAAELDTAFHAVALGAVK